MVPGTLVVVECGGAVLFSVARSAETMAPAPGADSGGSGGVCAGVSRGMLFPAVAREGRRDFSGGRGCFGDRLPAGDFRETDAEDPCGVGTGDDCAGGAGSGVSGRVAVSHHFGSAVCAVAGDASLDCGTAAARSAEAILDFERSACGLVGADQLQPLLVAAVVCVRRASPAVVFRIVCDRAGQRFVLLCGTANAAGARADKRCSEEGECIGECSLNRMLRNDPGRRSDHGAKARFTLELYAALKRRSFTVLCAALPGYSAILCHGAVRCGGFPVPSTGGRSLRWRMTGVGILCRGTGWT